MDIPDPGPSTLKRRVSFAADVKSPASASGSPMPATPVSPEVPKETPRVDGVIGQMEVYRSGAVKMRLGNGIVLNVWSFPSTPCDPYQPGYSRFRRRHNHHSSSRPFTWTWKIKSFTYWARSTRDLWSRQILMRC